MKRTFFLKLFSTFLVGTILFSTAVLYIVFSKIEEHGMETVYADLQPLCAALVDQLTPLLVRGDDAEITTSVRRLGQDTRVRITVVKNGGEVVADSWEDPTRMANHAGRSEIVAAFAGRTGQALRYSDTIKQDMLYVAIPVSSAQGNIAVVRVSRPLRGVSALYHKVERQILWLSLIVVLVTSALSYMISHRLNQPVHDLAAAAEQVSAGNFETKVFPKGSGELRDLASAFNQMTTQIHKLFTELSQQRQELEIIYDSIREGLVVLDRDCRIRRANTAFIGILGRADITGQLYWEVWRNPAFADLLIQARQTHQGQSGEITHGDRTYHCSLTFLPQQDEAVALFFDVTEMKRLAEVKRDLAVNVSHEFKTPLTAIRGFLEALADEEPIRNREYLEIIQRNVERLTRITQDLMTLARLEARTPSLELESVDLLGVVGGITGMFQPLLEQKELKLMVVSRPDIQRVLADRFLLEQVLINLVENAIKYTERGGITIRLSNAGNFVTVEVEDTGMGIPTEHLPRIFERFYVVDKSRSRELGGTGLGLAIVKNIILQHGGKIDVRSTLGQGSVFILSLPAAERRGNQEFAAQLPHSPRSEA